MDFCPSVRIAFCHSVYCQLLWRRSYVCANGIYDTSRRCILTWKCTPSHHFLSLSYFCGEGKKRRKCSSGWRIHHRNGKRANERERAKAPTNSIIVIVTIRIEWKYWVWQDSHFRTTYLATQQLFTLSCVSLQCMDLYTLAEKKGLFPSISCPLLAAQWCKNPDFGIWSIFQKRNDLIHLWFWILWNLFWVLYLLLDFDPILVRFLNIFFPNVCRKLECFTGKERFFFCTKKADMRLTDTILHFPIPKSLIPGLKNTWMYSHRFFSPLHFHLLSLSFQNWVHMYNVPSTMDNIIEIQRWKWV